MEKDALLGIILVVTILLISLAVYVKLKNLSVEATNQQLCKLNILKTWKEHSFSILNVFGRFRKPGFYGCKTTFAVINQKGIYEGRTPVVEFSDLKNKDEINKAIMKFLADEMAKCWSTFYEGDSNLFDFNEIIKRDYGDTGAICITCDDINIEYLPYGKINHSDFINFLKNNYLNITENNGASREETYYDFLYGKQSSEIKDLQVTLWNRIVTNWHSLTDLRALLFKQSTGIGKVSANRIIATLASSILSENGESYEFNKPKNYLVKIGRAYNPKNTNIWISCDDKNNLYKSSNSGTSLLASSGAYYCLKDTQDVLTCIDKNVYRVNGNFCSGDAVMKCTSTGPIEVETCSHGCKYGTCGKLSKSSNKGSGEDIVPGDYNILFYVVGRPVYMKNPVPFILLINVKDLFNNCDWLSMR